ncbi:hypothetical protein L1D14_07590 [Vibrio tubiashii]|nr:hypothetical protein [Vibrio tubiashii]
MKNEDKTYSAIRKFVASALFLLCYIYQTVHSNDLLMISLLGLGFIVCLIQGLREVLAPKAIDHEAPQKVTYSDGKKVE